MKRLDVQNHSFWKLLSLVKKSLSKFSSHPPPLAPTPLSYLFMLFEKRWWCNFNSQIQGADNQIYKCGRDKQRPNCCEDGSRCPWSLRKVCCTDACHCRSSKCCNRVMEANQFNATSSELQIILYKNSHFLLSSIRIALCWS